VGEGQDAGLADGTPIAGFPEWEAVKAQYGNLETIAGKAERDSNGTNLWKAEFEGKSAKVAELSRPHFAMADEQGNIYIADKEAHAIRKVTPDGNIATVAGTNVRTVLGDPFDPGPARERTLNNPNGLYVLPNGTFYILDLGNSRIRKVTAGQMTTVYHFSDGFSTGRGLYVSEDEKEIFFCAGQRVMRWPVTSDATGEAVEDAGGFVDLGNLAAMTGPGPRRFLVSDRVGNRVFELLEAKDGKVVKRPIAGNGMTGRPDKDHQPALEIPLHGVRAVWPHESGGFFAGTHKGPQVWYVDPRGFAHLFLDGRTNLTGFPGDGQPFTTPGKKIGELRSLSLDKSGNMIIVERDEGTVRIVRRVK
jgi:hypothetical protein